MNEITTIVFDLGGVIVTIDHDEAVRRFHEIGLKDAEQQLDPYTQSGIFGDLELGTITAAGIPMQAMGNRFLLDNPVKIQIQCSRSMNEEEIEHYKEDIIQRAKSERAIVVSPCISPGEQQTATAAMAAGIPLIVLLLNGLPPLFKPQPRYLEACEEGRLLMLAPFPYQNEKLENMRQRCLQLNAYAAEICKDD